MRNHNFSAGPGILPLPVLESIQQDLFDYKNAAGCSVLEMSHRSKEFESIIQQAESDLCALMDIPDNYHVLFMQGGATAQFSCIPLNLAQSLDAPVDYVITGQWSSKAYKEAKLLGLNANVVLTTQSTQHNGLIPEKWSFSPNASYIFYVSNETVHGVELDDDQDAFFDRFPPNVPIVCDMSSNILSRKVNVSKYGCIIAGAQKNMGPAGVTIVIIRKDLIRPADVIPPIPLPTILNYRTYSESKSLYNTPPTFTIYVCGLVFKHLLELGGLEEIARRAQEKSSRLYAVIEKYPRVYKSPLANKKYASRMNVVWRILDEKGDPDAHREAQFVKQADSLGLVCLKGHRDVGGLRASLYNALDISSVDALVSFMHDFAAKQ